VKVLVDTNILLDIALDRKPFVEHASLLWRLAEQKKIIAYISSTSITDIFYICRKYLDKDSARSFIADILDTFTLVGIDEQGFREAFEVDIIDFEDAVHYIISQKVGCDALVTRNKKDFGNKPDVLTPEEFIKMLEGSSEAQNYL